MNGNLDSFRHAKEKGDTSFILHHPLISSTFFMQSSIPVYCISLLPDFWICSRILAVSMGRVHSSAAAAAIKEDWKRRPESACDIAGERSGDCWYRGGRDGNGRQHGLYRCDYEDGEYYICEYDHGSDCGHWIMYNKDGSIKREWDY